MLISYNIIILLVVLIIAGGISAYFFIRKKYTNKITEENLNLIFQAIFLAGLFGGMFFVISDSYVTVKEINQANTKIVLNSYIYLGSEFEYRFDNGHNVKMNIDTLKYHITLILNNTSKRMEIENIYYGKAGVRPIITSGSTVNYILPYNIFEHHGESINYFGRDDKPPPSIEVPENELYVIHHWLKW